MNNATGIHQTSIGETKGDSWQTTLRAQVYFALRRSLTQSQRDTLKRKLAASRKKFSRAYLLAYGGFTARKLVDELKKRLSPEFKILMVHSAYDGLLPMYRGTPIELVNELLEFCGKDRTLAMPAFVLGGRRYDKEKYFSSHPFDSRRTPSEMGLLTEIFRRMPGVLRSLHPTHSICAIGPLAQELTVTHHVSGTRTGRGTPFDIMARKRTEIIGLGVEYYRCLAQTHIAEDMLGEAFPIQFERKPFPVVLIDSEGKKLGYDLTIPKTSLQLDNTGLHSLLPKNALSQWTFRGVSLFAADAAAITNCLIDAAQRGITLYRSDTGRVRVTSSSVPS